MSRNSVSKEDKNKLQNSCKKIVRRYRIALKIARRYRIALKIARRYRIALKRDYKQFLR